MGFIILVKQRSPELQDLLFHEDQHLWKTSQLCCVTDRARGPGTPTAT